MKKINAVLSTVLIALSTSAHAQTSAKYELTLTNGSSMPFSPPVIYSKNGAESAAQIGQLASAGFVQICQSGNSTTRIAELRSKDDVRFVNTMPNMIMPGESKTIEVEIANPQKESLHVESMYGKTKDVCALISVNSHSLVALQQHISSEVVVRDTPLLTGAFTDPSLPTGMTNSDANFCKNASSAVACIRELSVDKPDKTSIRFFSGYLPSFTTALEMKYGATEAQSLQIPSAGVLQLKLKLKH